MWFVPDQADAILYMIASAIAVSAIIPLSLFVYYYGSKPVPGHKHRRRYSSIWRLTDIGRTMMYQKVAWIVFLIFIAVQIYVPRYPGKEEIRMAIYICLVFLFWRMFYTLRKTQKSSASQSDTGPIPIEQKKDEEGSADQENKVD